MPRALFRKLGFVKLGILKLGIMNFCCFEIGGFGFGSFGTRLMKRLIISICLSVSQLAMFFSHFVVAVSWYSRQQTLKTNFGKVKLLKLASRLHRKIMNNKSLCGG
jgi:hypothetical protein